MDTRPNPTRHLALACLLATILMAGPAQGGRHQNADVTLVSFGSMQGELVTCGCHASPKGGLARRAAVIDSLQAEGTTFLHLELGDFSELDEVSGAYETRTIWNVFERTGVHAIAPGPRELTMWNTIDSLRSASRIPFLASNLEITCQGRSSEAGRPYHIFKTGGLKVAVFALLGSRELESARPPDGVVFAVRDPVDTARELLPKLRKKADIVVLISQMEPAATERLVRDLPGIDVALYGQRPQWQAQASRIDHTIVNQTGTRGQYAGRLTLIANPAGEVIDFGSRNLVLDNSVPEDPAIAALVEATEARVKEMRAQRREEQRVAIDKAISGGH